MTRPAYRKLGRVRLPCPCDAPCLRKRIDLSWAIREPPTESRPTTMDPSLRQRLKSAWVRSKLVANAVD